MWTNQVSVAKEAKAQVLINHSEMRREQNITVERISWIHCIQIASGVVVFKDKT